MLYFTRKLNLAIQSRFPGLRIIIRPPLLIPYVQWDIENELLCHSDRIAQDLHLIPSSEHNIQVSSTLYVQYGIILQLSYNC